jgi:hypothetical protein
MLTEDAKYHWLLGNRFAVEGLKILLLLNGIGALTRGYGWFVIGTFFAVLAHVTAYAAQFSYGDEFYRGAVKFHNATYVLVGWSILCFCFGALHG